MPPAIPIRLRRGATIAASTVALLVGSIPAAGADDATSPESAAAPRPATPQLIQEALDAGSITGAQATLYRAWSLVRPGALPPEYVSTTPWSGTLTMLQVKRDLARLDPARMSPALRDVAARIVSTCPGSTGSLPNTKSTNHFYFKYRASAIGGGLTIGQYAAALETVWKTEVGTFGWARPPKDPVNPPPGGRYLVRVVGLSPGLYGYVAGTYYVHNNPATPWNEHDSAASCMVLNQDFSGFPSGPVESLRSTTAHEFNHSIQYGYGALTGFGHVKPVFVEGGAAWMEDEVFDGSDDNYFYLWPNFTKPMAQYNQQFPYPYWVVFRAMIERYGTGEKNGSESVMQFFWEQLSKESSTNLAAMGRALKSKGTTLAKAYHDAAIALRFNLDCSGTPRRWCLEEGPAYVTSAGPNGNTGNVATIGDPAYQGKVANDYALDWIGIPEGQGSFDLTVNATTGGGRLRTSVMCRRGATLELLAPIEVAHGTTNATFPGVNPAGCDAVVAVITNEHQTKPSPSVITSSSYTLRTVAAT